MRNVGIIGPKNFYGCDLDHYPHLSDERIFATSKRAVRVILLGETMSDRVRDACESCFEAHKDDCSGFVRAVANQLGVTINGLASEIVDTIRAGGAWQALPDGPAAARSAAAHKLVLAGLRGDEQFDHSNHGHVVVVVDGPLAHGRYPSAYWGSLGGEDAKFETINWAWTEHDRDRVTYAEHDL